MALRPDSKPNRDCIYSYAVKSGTTTVAGRAVIDTTTEREVDNAGTGANACGIAQESITGDGSTRIPVYRLSGGGVIPVLVGTGGATAGKYAVCAADGLTDAPTLGGGTVARYILGKFTQTGIVGDMVGLEAQGFVAVSA